jgi:hypothetical protein
MWSLFPELLGPMILAFVAGSLFAWVFVGLLLPRRPSTTAPADQPTGPRGPR